MEVTRLSLSWWLSKVRPCNSQHFWAALLTTARPGTGTVFDVSNKAEVYGPGKSYSIFAGKDGSRGLGLSSLKAEDAVADYSTLDEKERKVLDDWHAFFS